MPSTTSGSTLFTLDVDDIIEQAQQPLGGEHQTAETAKKARRLLNLLLITMQNKNIPISKLDFVTQALDTDTATYTLDTGIRNVLQCSISSTTATDELPIRRLGLKEYQQFPKKDQSDRPNSFVTERTNNAVTITFWPVPPDATYTAHLMVSKLVEDVNASYQQIDLPTTYLPLVVAWLTYDIAANTPNFPLDRIAFFKGKRDEVMTDVFDEDRERVDFTVRPGGISGR